MELNELLTVAGIAISFYMLGRLHESVISFRKHVEDLYKNVG